MFRVALGEHVGGAPAGQAADVGAGAGDQRAVRAVQDAFLVLHARYGKLRDPLPYLYKVIQNQARAEWRRRAIERPDPYAADLASPPVPSFEDQVVANSRSRLAGQDPGQRRASAVPPAARSAHPHDVRVLAW